jgi:hypothetical protein
VSDILILAGASDRDRATGLLKTAEKHNAPLHLLPHGGGMEELRLANKFLHDRSEEYIIASDAFDVLINRWDERELRMLIDSAPHLIMSVEGLVWPAGPWERAYARLGSRYFWKAICGGQYCGRRADMIAAWDEMLMRWDRGDAKAGGSSQEILHQMYADGWPFTLDLECRIFQSMLGDASKWICLHGGDRGLAWNRKTQTLPMFLHFNGMGPGEPPLMAEWRKRICEP